MGGMFNDASIFNQDLCAWGEKFLYDSDDSCSSSRIFSNSGCAFQEPPQISQRQRGPFCAADCRRFKCFSLGVELKAVIDLYMNDDGCTSDDNDIYSTCRFARVYGWPMNSWCVSRVADMSALFYKMANFNENISAWNTSSATSMKYMFYGAKAFNSNLSSWDVSSVTSMRYMFYETTSFQSDLSNWNVSSVTNMESMLDKAPTVSPAP